MRKALTLAILGTALVASAGARAQTTPAFIGATACEAAAPLRTEAVVARRAVSARGTGAVSARGTEAVDARRTDRAETARGEQRHAARGGRSVARSAQPSAEARTDGARTDGARTDQAAAEVPEEGPVLRRALHFCVGTPGARRAWMT